LTLITHLDSSLKSLNLKIIILNHFGKMQENTCFSKWSIYLERNCYFHTIFYTFPLDSIIQQWNHPFDIHDYTLSHYQRENINEELLSYKLRAFLHTLGLHSHSPYGFILLHRKVVFGPSITTDTYFLQKSWRC